ncbi:hypothetical protein AVEN_158711-1 [Araneus ventricosus]|uniref:Uncharacterized protein n=1 Tax=Araneus ventricosus TaxID=182803 RepID=A0A4Y2HVU6_ARAVE|nr:hypothetical protein AVEN_158711-1 [Araneus ventricosus]
MLGNVNAVIGVLFQRCQIFLAKVRPHRVFEQQGPQRSTSKNVRQAFHRRLQACILLEDAISTNRKPSCEETIVNDDVRKQFMFPFISTFCASTGPYVPIHSYAKYGVGYLVLKTHVYVQVFVYFLQDSVVFFHG